MILNIYKPRGFTSFDIVAKVKKHLNTKKVGHAGTLDPLAEGVLVVLTEKDTKQQDQIMKRTKVYDAEITFGIETPSLDLEFEPVLSKPITLDEVKDKLPAIVKKYVGEFDQRIPDFSAKKIKGKPMYETARKNLKNVTGTGAEPTEPLFKKVKIDEIQILTYGEREYTVSGRQAVLPFVTIKVTCSHGTYIRSLARDFGDDLNCGGVLTKLVRTKVGNYSVENSLPLDNLESNKSYRPS